MNSNRDVPDNTKSAWVSRARQETQKPWGYEIAWAGFGGIHGKTLFIREGERTSLKYNLRKTEVLMLRSGSAEVCFGDEIIMIKSKFQDMKVEILEQGDTLLVQSGCPYRITALSDCEIFEIGDNSSDNGVMIDDDYGRVK